MKKALEKDYACQTC